MRHWIDHVSLLAGWLPSTVFLVGVLALAFLLVRRSWRWWVFNLLAAGAGAGLTVLLGWAVIHVWYVWPEDLPAEVLVWVGVAVWAVLLAGGTVVVRATLRHRLGAPVAAALVVALAASQVNAYFGALTNLGDLIHGPPTVTAGISRFLAKKPGADPFRVAPVSRSWHAPAQMAHNGTLRQVVIPGTVSGFHARKALVYFPPAYLLAHRPALPVLVLISGQPGGPSDWLTSADLPQALDAFAAAHHGLAPVVIMPDPNGANAGNTMCMDSRLARADTYLSVDVPHWITSTLAVDRNTEHWAVGGFSFGGTCAVQMSTRHPHLYPTFAAMSPEREPALTANRQRTIALAFNGNSAAFNAELPLTLLANHKYPGVRGWFSAGESDHVYTDNVHVLHAAAQKAGMRTTVTAVPGGHSWLMITQTLPLALNFLAKPLGLTSQ
ncbi:esterase [Paenarthrobacter sp. Z7-10]|uniref:alpha/beta hydrolase n=1 Tax=Paenarthrobacter sp. Z7-10 TaxID=2787635 RepID=UPI0022A97100|nr:alpha/beta hydrolase-fold protein [Paenarthrobacter sp. Z7-10]MCZ2403124.1 esterase [Paenarthrobacter sp. Z7-10]